MGVLSLFLGPPPPATAAVRAADDQASPLKVSIDTLTPSTVPARGRVTITGQITNTSDATWTNLQVYMLRSTTPITSQGDLAAAAASEPQLPVGSRLTSAGLYDEVGDLAPGQSTSYVVSVGRRDLGLSGRPGVYWFGVHVLAAQNGVRDSVADGRARTFLPLVPPGTPRTKLSLQVPVMEPVHRDRDGRLIGLRHWQRILAPDGRLDRLLRLTGRSTEPVTWIVDPAVLDAARSVSHQNPPLDIGPTDQPSEGQSSDSPSPSPSSDQAAPSGPGAAGGGSPGPRDAAAWLQTFRSQAAGHPVAAVPYGNLDLAAAAGQHARLYQVASDLSARTMTATGVKAVPLVAPPDGYLPRKALRRLGPRDAVLMSDRAFPSATRPVLSTAHGARIVLTDAAAGTAGPGPGARHSALAVRQRLLSEAALHALSGDHGRPLVVSTPPGWDPGPAWSEAGFFEGLTVPWLTMVGLPPLIDAGRTGTAPGGLVFPAWERQRALPPGNVLAAHDLLRTGRVFATLLTLNSSVDEQLAKLGLLASGTQARSRPRAAARRVRATNAHIRQLMARVRVEGPPFVTMSSSQGPIQITVVNGLDQEVTVGVRARTGSPNLRITSPDPVSLGPGRRASLRLTAKARDIGVHRVRLEATNAAGRPLGSTAQFTVRTSQVGRVIWVIMGAGGAVLLLAIGMRLLRRVRRRVATRGPRLSRGGR